MTRRKPTARTCGVLAFEMGEGEHEERRMETRLRRGHCCAEETYEGERNDGLETGRHSECRHLGGVALEVPVYSLSPTQVGICACPLNHSK